MTSSGCEKNKRTDAYMCNES